MAFCQVRVFMPLSEPARYALVTWRLSAGWRVELFLASMIWRASFWFVVPRRVRLPVVVSTQYTGHPECSDRLSDNVFS